LNTKARGYKKNKPLGPIFEETKRESAKVSLPKIGIEGTLLQIKITKVFKTKKPAKYKVRVANAVLKSYLEEIF